MKGKHIPVIIGAGEVKQEVPKLSGEDTAKITPEKLGLKNAIELTVEAVKVASKAAGISATNLQKIQSISVVDIATHSGFGIPGQIARHLGIHRRLDTLETRQGAQNPISIVNFIARNITLGILDYAVLCGGEIGATRRRFTDLSRMRSEFRSLFPDEEESHGMTIPGAYAVCANAYRAAHGISRNDLLRIMGTLMKGFSEVANGNPNAWFKGQVEPEEIYLKSPMVAEPFTVSMCANPFVDLAAAVIITSVDRARQLGVPEANWVYIKGLGGECHDTEFILDRQEVHRSLPAKVASERALESAGIDRTSQIDILDLYSCFPIVPIFLLEAMGVSPPGRAGWDILEGKVGGKALPLTVTGGLPFFGGPMSNYCTHAAARIWEKLRNTEKTGVAFANGGVLSSFAMAIFSGAPGYGKSYKPVVMKDPEESLLRETIKPVTVCFNPEGKATIKSYTVIHMAGNTRDKTIPLPYGVIYGLLEKDARQFISIYRGNHQDLIDNEVIGMRGVVTTREDGLAFFRLD